VQEPRDEVPLSRHRPLGHKAPADHVFFADGSGDQVLSTVVQVMLDKTSLFTARGFGRRLQGSSRGDLTGK